MRAPMKMGRGCLAVGRNSNQLEDKPTPVASKGSVQVGDVQVEASFEASFEGFVLVGGLMLKPLLKPLLILAENVVALANREIPLDCKLFWGIQRCQSTDLRVS